LTIFVVAALLAAAIHFLSRGRSRRGQTPGSTDGPHPINPASGYAPPFGRSERNVEGNASTRAEQVIHDLRIRAAEQLIEHVGGAYAPDALRSLLEEIGDPAAAVARLIELLGENPVAVVAGPGESRTAFLDRLDAFVRLETEVRSISPDSNRRIFTLLREGRADDVRLWAEAVRSAQETEALLTHIETLAPGPIGILASLRSNAGSLSRRACEFLPEDVATIATELEILKLSAQALFRFAEDWHNLDRKREKAEAEIQARWDPEDPFCMALFARMEPLFAAMEAAWKAIGHKRTGVAELRGHLDDLDVQIASLASMAAELKSHANTRAGSSSGGASGGPHRRKSGTYGPDGRDRTARASADPFQAIWEYFGFGARPTLEECRAARNRMLRANHPDIVGPSGTAKTREINDWWARAHEKLRGVTA